MSNDAKQCPWCARWFLKDSACNYIFACGLPTGGGQFVVGTGCGRSWCWECGKKFCGVYIDPTTGVRCTNGRDQHNASCCTFEPGFSRDTYCCGGHESHCPKRW